MTLFNNTLEEVHLSKVKVRFKEQLHVLFVFVSEPWLKPAELLLILRVTMQKRLTHSFPMHPFSGFLMFSGGRERVIGNEWVNQISFWKHDVIKHLLELMIIKSLWHWGQCSSMSLDIYLYKLYLILTVTKQEVDDGLNVCVIKCRPTIAWMFLNPP